MKIYQIALSMLILSGVVTLFNELNVFNFLMYAPGYAANITDIQGIASIDINSVVDTREGWMDKLYDFGVVAIGVFWIFIKSIGLALNLGSLFTQYVPGNVGTKFGLFITGITWFIYAWAIVQWRQKVSTKGMD